MKKVLYVLNDCMRKFSYERVTGLYRCLEKAGESFNLYVLRTDAYSGYDAEHNRGEYSICRLPDYDEYDGIILDINSVFSENSGKYLQDLQDAARASAASGRPVISIANRIPGLHYVGIDNYDAMGSVIRHLHLHHGLTDFWFALGPNDNYENQTRERSLRDYCAASGLPCGEDRFYSESFIIECGIHAFKELYSRHGGRLPQAVICANDHIAMGVCHAAKAAGFSVPEDFLVTGFDNTDRAASFSPAITSVDQQCWNTGEAVTSALRRLWKGESIAGQITTPTRLVLRKSTEGTSFSDTDLLRETSDFIGSASSDTDFNYKMSAMQYRLPACKSIEEICEALIDCIAVLNCDGIDLVMDSRIFDLDRVLSFRNKTGQMMDISSSLSVDGYPDSLELVFHWEKGMDPVFPRQKIGNRLSSLPYQGAGANYLFSPLHFMEHTVGYLCIRNCLDLLRIKGVSVTVSTLTMALRTFFTSRSLSYINHVLAGVSMKDGLTGLYNRLGYYELAIPLYRELSARGGKLGILFIDLDRLKYLNDRYGHATGDLAIRCVADAILHGIPQGAIPVRYGGDEFLVLLPDIGPEALRAIPESLASSIPERSEELSLPELPGISTGFVLAEACSSKSLKDYITEADELMYREKKAKKALRRDE